MKLQTITIKEYLVTKGVKYKELGAELITKCLFGDCDDDSSPSEAHLYFSSETGQYDCKKCGAKGNIFTLREHFGDEMKDIALNPHYPLKIVKKELQNSIKSAQDTKLIKLGIDDIKKLHISLPKYLKEWLEHERRLTPEVIEKTMIGYGKYYGRYWITIPFQLNDGSYGLKLRKLPNDNSDVSRYMVYPKGTKHQLFGAEPLKGQLSKVVITEGEFDRLVIESHGVQAVSSTGGAKTFKEEWLPLFVNIPKIYVCYDNDDEGINGAIRVMRLLKKSHPSAEIMQILLPKIDGVKDITDFFKLTNYQPEKSRIEAFFDPVQPYSSEVEDNELQTEEPKYDANSRFPSFEAPSQKIVFNDWSLTIEKHFPEFVFTAEACASVMLQLLINDVFNPFGLVLVDVPSSGKTIILNFFTGLTELVYSTDKFSPASFVSHAVNVKAKDLSKIDLLPKIRFRVLLVRELATIFSDREEDLTKNIGILTRVFDGEGLQIESGVHGQRGYQGNYLFMFFGASTPISHRVWKAMGNFGPRLLFIEVNSKEKTEDQLVSQLRDNNWKEKEKACREITTNFIKTIFSNFPNGIDWDKNKDEHECLKQIGRCAKLLAHLRAPINVWKEYGNNAALDHSVPVKEMPDRINQLLYNLARGHAVVCGRNFITVDDLRVVIEVTFASAPPTRVKVFKHLIKNGGDLSTNETISLLSCSRPTALKELKALAILGIVDASDDGDEAEDLERHIKLKDKFNWFLSDECKQLLGLYTPPLLGETQWQNPFMAE